MKKVMSLLVMLVTVVSLFGCSNEENENMLVMGTSADYYPFQFIEIIDGVDHIVGFDIDIANYIADYLGMELEIIDMDFGTLITALRSDRVDMVLASMSPTEERAQVVDFSNVYYQSNPGWILSSSNLQSMDELDGLTLGVQTGSLQYDIGNGLIEDGIDVDLLVMDRVPDLVQQLLAGRADAIIVNQLTAFGAQGVQDGLYAVDIIPPVGLGAAIAFQQGSDLTAQVNDILAHMEETGVMAELIARWLPDGTE